MNIVALDHIVLTVRDMEATIQFYQRVLGMRHELFDGKYNALHFGPHKINLHPYRSEYSPHADITLPGAGDLCLISDGAIESVVAKLESLDVKIELGPVDKTGAKGSMRSVYIRDPDRNLVEVACYPTQPLT